MFLALCCNGYIYGIIYLPGISDCPNAIFKPHIYYISNLICFKLSCKQPFSRCLGELDYSIPFLQ